MNNNFNNDLLVYDELSILMVMLISFIGIIVAFFAKNYMKGDRKYKSFFASLLLLVLSTITMVCANNVFLFLFAWTLSNLTLVKLMIHKAGWRAAKESGLLTFRTFAIGFFFIAAAFLFLFFSTGELSIEAINKSQDDSDLTAFALVFILIAAMGQSAIYPFHKWLISSLNSPLPVSAMMHAGIVNGGGFLIARFAHLYLNFPLILKAIFILGLFSAITGTLWKLIQSDVKRMLACSTMAQMGFMFMQCGLGIFSSAIAHIILHGCFKSYLFLSSASAAQEKRFNLHYPPSFISFALALVCGVVGSYLFTLNSHFDLLNFNSSSVLILVVTIAGTSLALAVLRNNNLKLIPLALLITSVGGMLYGFNIELVDKFLDPLDLFQTQEISMIYIFGAFILTIFWLLIVFSKNYKAIIPNKVYVYFLNASQPDPKTITAYRNYYRY